MLTPLKFKPLWQSIEKGLLRIFQAIGNILLQRCRASLTKHRQWSTKVNVLEKNVCSTFFFYFFFIFFIFLFLAVSGLRFVRGLSLVAASRGHSSSRCGDCSSSRCTGLSLSRPLPLRGTGSRRAGSVVVAHGPSCSVACGILPDQGSNPCPLH